MAVNVPLPLNVILVSNILWFLIKLNVCVFMPSIDNIGKEVQNSIANVLIIYKYFNLSFITFRIPKV